MHPRLFQFGHFVLPTYGVLLAAGLIAALLVCQRTARVLALDTDKVWNLALLAVVSAIVGARLLPVAMEWRRYGIAAFSIPFSNSLGALLGAAAPAAGIGLLYALHARLPLRATADALAPSLALLGSVNAIGCFEAGCGFGTPTHLPWAVVFTNPYAAAEAPLGIPLHPTQLYESAAAFAIFLLLLELIRRPHRAGEIFGAWLFLAGIADFFFAFVRGDKAGGELIGGIFTGGQLVAVAMVIAGAGLWLDRGPTVNALAADERRSA